jgi:hypothetical protein
VRISEPEAAVASIGADLHEVLDLAPEYSRVASPAMRARDEAWKSTRRTAPRLISGGVTHDTPVTERMRRQAAWFAAHRDDRLIGEARARRRRHPHVPATTLGSDSKGARPA